MTTIGPNHHSTIAPGGCGGGGPLPRPGRPAGGFPTFPGGGASSPFNGERFITSAKGGLILDKDGALAGRVPEGTIIDTKDGTLYGPDNKPITIPEGSKVDFLDLPDLEEILEMVDGGGPAEGEIADADRFVPSAAGGIIVGADGAPAGRIPAGSFIDLKDGKVYGPDSKVIEIPDGAKVDFFDLPSLDELRATVRGGGPGGKDEKATGGTIAVDGQWGPGGVTEIKGGTAAPEEDCGMDHGADASKAGGPGSAFDPKFVQQQIKRLEQILANRGTLPSGLGGSHPTIPAGPGSAVGGASGLGSIPSLELSLKDLVATLSELAKALQIQGGGVEQRTGAQVAADALKAATESPATESTPTTESTPASSSTPSTSSSSSTSD